MEINNNDDLMTKVDLEHPPVADAAVGVDTSEAESDLNFDVDLDNSVVVTEVYSEDKIDLDNMLVEFTKGFTLDKLDIPEIKRKALRVFGLVKSIYTKDVPDYALTDKEWGDLSKRLSTNITNSEERLKAMWKKVEDKKQEIGRLKGTLKDDINDLSIINEQIAPKEQELVQLKLIHGNISKEIQGLKHLKTKVFAKEKELNHTARHVTVLLTSIILLKERLLGKSEMLDSMCETHSTETKEKLIAYIDDFINDEALNLPINDELYYKELADIAETSLESKKTEADYFKNLSVSTLMKLAELFKWEIEVKPNPGEEGDVLVVSQLLKKLNLVTMKADPIHTKFSNEDIHTLSELYNFLDMYVGNSMNKLLEKSLTTIAAEGKEAVIKTKCAQLHILAKYLFTQVENKSQEYKDRLMDALVLSSSRLDSISVILLFI